MLRGYSPDTLYVLDQCIQLFTQHLCWESLKGVSNSTCSKLKSPPGSQTSFPLEPFVSINLINPWHLSCPHFTPPNFWPILNLLGISTCQLIPITTGCPDPSHHCLPLERPQHHPSFSPSPHLATRVTFSKHKSHCITSLLASFNGFSWLLGLSPKSLAWPTWSQLLSTSLDASYLIFPVTQYSASILAFSCPLNPPGSFTAESTCMLEWPSYLSAWKTPTHLSGHSLHFTSSG